MLLIDEQTRIPVGEIQWRFSRSGGPGGQNVNKVSTRATLIFDVLRSTGLTDEQKNRIIEKLKRFIDKEGVLQIHVDEERSQLRNREIALDRFRKRLANALRVEKDRLPTTVPFGSQEKRLLLKKGRSRLKISRRGKKDWQDDDRT